jgi:outer membrane protein assembly factor BamB
LDGIILLRVLSNNLSSKASLRYFVQRKEYLFTYFHLNNTASLRRICLLPLALLVSAALLFQTARAQTLSADTSCQSSAKGQLALSQPLILHWQYASDSTVNLTPAVAVARVYLPLASGTLLALCSTGGQLLWKADVGGEISASPEADERAVYIASATALLSTQTAARSIGALRALGREGGVAIWMRTLPAPLQGALAISRTAIFGGSSNGTVYAIQKNNGEILWRAQFASPFTSQPLAAGTVLYIGGDDGQFTALDQTTGAILWRYRTRGAIRGGAVMVEDVVYFGSSDNYVYAVGAKDGRLRWRARTGAGVQAVAHTANGLLVPSLDNFVYLLSFAHGDRLWKRQLPGRLAVAPLAAPDGALFTPLSADTGIVLDLRDGKQLNSLPLGKDGSMAAAPVFAGSVLLVTTRHGLLAFARAPDGKSLAGN